MYKRVMVPLDGSKLAECALQHVEGLAEKGLAQEVLFVRVVDPLENSVAGLEGGTQSMVEQMMREAEQKVTRDKSTAREYLDRVVSRCRAKNIKVHAEVLQGQAAETLIEYAEKNSVDFIVIATHGRSGVSRWIRGSTADRILTSARVPVMMIPAPGCGPQR